MNGVVKLMCEMISESARRKGESLAEKLDYTKSFDDFKWDVYNTACLGCSKRISPPGMAWSQWQHKFVIALCRKQLKRCPAKKYFHKWHELHSKDK